MRILIAACIIAITIGWVTISSGFIAHNVTAVIVGGWLATSSAALFGGAIERLSRK